MKKSPIRVYDARWEVGDFSPSEIERLFIAACAYGRELDSDAVVISRDGRLGCPAVVDVAMETARQQGYAVYLCQEPISTPQSYYNVLRVTEDHPHAMGWMITASHNPATYIGVKFVVAPVRAIGLDSGPYDGLRRIQELYDQTDGTNAATAPERGRLRFVNYSNDFIADTFAWAGVHDGELEGTAVVLDALNGSAATEIYRGLDRAGVEVTPLRIVTDGSFPSGAPNPISAGKLDTAVSIAHGQSGSIVVGLDGDGDRVVFGDGDGLISAGAAMVPILTRLKEMDPHLVGAVLCDPKVDPLSLARWTDLGFHPVLFRNGHSQIKDYMLTKKIAVAVEESGHYYHRVQRGGLGAYCENSLLTILLFLKAVRDHPAILYEMKTVTESVHSTGELNYQFPSDRERDDALAKAVARLRADGAVIADRTADGIELEGTAFVSGVDIHSRRILSDAWYCGFHRASTNEKSVARFYFSSGSKHVLSALADAVRTICEVESGGTPVE